MEPATSCKLAEGKKHGKTFLVIKTRHPSSSLSHGEANMANNFWKCYTPCMAFYCVLDKLVPFTTGDFYIKVCLTQIGMLTLKYGNIILYSDGVSHKL